MNAVKYASLAFALVFLASTTSRAGVYTDDLSRCLVESTSKQDRLVLVKWIFSAASLHPAVRSVVTVSEEHLDQANKGIAELFMRLVTDSCRTETEKALKYEGESTLQASFQVLGQVAGQELFSSPEVGTAMTGMNKYLDEEKLRALGETK